MRAGGLRVQGSRGISPEGRITTLGRGGSDTTAVAFRRPPSGPSAATSNNRCRRGLHHRPEDHRQGPQASTASPSRKMLELASLGAKVLQTRSVRTPPCANKVRLRVLSSFEDNDEHAGTLVCDEEDIVERERGRRGRLFARTRRR